MRTGIPLHLKFLALTMSALLGACGGGGGDGGGTPAPDLPPVAVIGSDKQEGLAPLSVNFSGGGSSDDQPGLTWSWNFGDGSSATGSSASRTYANPGIYTVTVTVTDSAGQTASASQTITVAAEGDAFALSGNIPAPGNSFADCDMPINGVTDCNGTRGHAQRVVAPAIIGGNASATGDDTDFYSLTLTGGEVATLSTAEGSASLELRLYDAGGGLLATDPANLTVPATGAEYFLAVRAVSGASNYILTLGAAAATAAYTGSTDAFVPGELVLNVGRFLFPLTPGQAKAAIEQATGLDLAAGNIGEGPALMRIPDAIHARRPARTHERARVQRALARVRALAEVAWAEPNWLRQPQATAVDTYAALQWNLPLVNLSQAWTLAPELGTGTIVAVIDGGILPDHPDLAGRLVGGYDFVDDDADATDPGDDALGGGRSSFHGTHVSGIIAAATTFATVPGNSGIASVAPLAQVTPIRVVGQFGATSFDLAQAIRYAAGLSNSSSTLPAQAADVINMSLGSFSYSQVEQDAVTAARAAGSIIVAAAGNGGSSTPMYPAAYSGVVAVAATTINGTRAGYSSTGAHIDIAAPGGDLTTDYNGDGHPDGILSTLADDTSSGTPVYGYGFMQGTSMAAPHVAGVAALMRALDPTLTPAGFDLLLAGGKLSRDLGSSGRDDDFGFGLLDAERAIASLAGLGSIPARVVTSPDSLHFHPATDSIDFLVDAAGNGIVSVSAVTGSAPWLGVTTVDVDPVTGTGLWRATVNRDSLANGNFTATIDIESSAGNLALPVSLSVDSGVTAPGFGTLFVIVLDLDDIDGPTGGVVAQAQLDTTSGGVYEWVAAQADITNQTVPAGNRYQVYVGTDNDNDFYICDAGEACGAWPSLDSPLVFANVKDRSDMDFNASYLAGLATQSSPARPARAFRRLR